ncbi:MAG: ROK family protein, partial [Vicinamibacteria bacterium]
MSGSLYVGVDLGGTQLRMAAVNSDGFLVSDLLSIPTGIEFGPSDLEGHLANLAGRVRSVVGDAVAALGFGTAGVIHPGPLTQSDNLPRLNGVDLDILVKGVFGCPVRIENDARCFSLAEARFGAGRGARSLWGITLGTGVGCGIVIDGRLHRGSTSEAGEVWRIPLRGAPLERALSGAGVVQAYRAAGGDAPEGIDAAGVAERARGGDSAAREAWSSFGEDLAFLCECAACLIDPDRIVLGGSISKSRDLFEPALGRRLGDRAARLAWAELGPAAGVIGAAALNIP